MARVFVLLCLLISLLGCRRSQASKPSPHALPGHLGTRVLVVERAAGSLAAYDWSERKLLPVRIEGLGDLHHATMTFGPDLQWGFLATRSGRLVRIDLTTLKVDGEVQTSKNSIDLGITHDGRTIGVAEYIPGGVTLVDAATMQVKTRIPSTSRVTGMVDAPGNKLVCVLIEGQEIWILDPSLPSPVTHKIKAGAGMPYDAMITADGRHYVVGKLGDSGIAVLDLEKPEAGVREVSLRDPELPADVGSPKKLPHMASWAQAGRYLFVPLVGEKRLAVLERETFSFVRSIPLRGHPVYTVRSPNERELWVSFSGEDDDAFLEVVDTQTLAVKRSLRVGRRVYHLDFTPRGSHVLVTANADEELVLVDAARYEVVDRQKLRSPSGIFSPFRAARLGL